MEYRGYIEWKPGQREMLREYVVAVLDAAQGTLAFQCFFRGKACTASLSRLPAATDLFDDTPPVDKWSGTVAPEGILDLEPSIVGREITWRGYWRENGPKIPVKLVVQPCENSC